MDTTLVAVTDHPDDLVAAQSIARELDIGVVVPPTPQAAHVFLADNPLSIVLWDGDSPELRKALARLKDARVPPHRVAVVTDGPLHEYPELMAARSYNHHILRRFDSPAAQIYARLLLQALKPFPFGLRLYLPKEIKAQSIRLIRSGQKNAAVEAIRTFLVKRGSVERVANLVAQAADEFVMNAAFDAPILATGSRYRRTQSRSDDFELEGGIEITVAAMPEYIGLSVADAFGSLDRAQMVNLLTRDYRVKAYEPKRNGPGAGLGIHGLVNSGVSLLVVCRPQMRTEVMAFFPSPSSFREFRKGFRFLSIMGI